MPVDNASSMAISSHTVITTTEMHSAGEPVRIVDLVSTSGSSDGGYPAVIPGRTLLEKRRHVRERLDCLRRFLMWEPRGHYDMYGALIMQPVDATDNARRDVDDEHTETDVPEADFAVLFMHNEGYSTMCGHAVIALGRYAVDHGLVAAERIREPETEVRIHCPCGVVTAYTEISSGRTTGRVRFHSVPAFAFALDVEIEVRGLDMATPTAAGRTIRVDIGYGGAFYAVAHDRDLDLDIRQSATSDIVRAATLVSDAVRSKVKLHHPDSEDLAFLYGTIVTDGQDAFSEQPTTNLTIFADREVDRAPTGSGVTARIAIQFARKLIGIGQVRTFESAANGSRYAGSVVTTSKCGDYDAVVVEVSGTGHYIGRSTFTAEDNDDLRGGFLLK